MFVHFHCADCGEAGSVSVELEADIPTCPRCGRVLSVERSGDEERAIHHGDVEDDVVSWVSQPLERTEARSDGEMICTDCGYAGAMSYDPDQGGVICPACTMVHRPKRPQGYGTIECPGCGRTVEYSDLDRGKTIICRGCKYFLGCVVPPEKHAYRAHRARNLR